MVLSTGLTPKALMNKRLISLSIIISLRKLENGSPSKPDYRVYLHTMVWQCVLAIKELCYICSAVIEMNVHGKINKHFDTQVLEVEILG